MKADRGYIREITRDKIIEHPVSSIIELKHWMDQVRQSGYLAMKKKEGVRFEVVIDNGKIIN